MATIWPPIRNVKIPTGKQNFSRTMLASPDATSATTPDTPAIVSDPITLGLNAAQIARGDFTISHDRIMLTVGTPKQTISTTSDRIPRVRGASSTRGQGPASSVSDTEARHAKR